jgi:hypothetical protein
MRWPNLFLLLGFTLLGGPVAAQAPITSTAKSAVRSTTTTTTLEFTVANTSRDTVVVHSACAGLGQLRCQGLDHPRLVVAPGKTADLTATVAPRSDGHGLVVVTAVAQGSRVPARVKQRLRVR